MSAKKLIEQKARDLGATFDRVSTKKVSFADLARAEARFIYFHGLKWSGENHWDELKALAREHGFILGS